MWRGCRIIIRCHTLLSLVLLSTTTGMSSPIFRLVAFANDGNASLITDTIDSALQQLDFVDLKVEYQLVTDNGGGFYPFVAAVNRKDVHAILGNVEDHLCEAAAALATVRHKLYISWGCPGVPISRYHCFGRSVLHARQVAVSMAAVLKTFSWKYCIIITSEEDSWAQLSVEMDRYLRSVGFIVRDVIVFSRSYTEMEVAEKLKKISLPIKAIILVMDLNSSLLTSILTSAYQTQLGDGRFAFFCIHVFSTLLPHYVPRLTPPVSDILRSLFVITAIDWRISYSQLKILTNQTDVGLSSSYIRRFDAASLLMSVLKRASIDKVDLLSPTTDIRFYLKNTTFPTLWNEAETTDVGDRRVRLLLLDYRPLDLEFQFLTDLEELTDDYLWLDAVDWPNNRPPMVDPTCVIQDTDCTHIAEDPPISGVDVIIVTVPIIAFIIVALGIVIVVRKKILYKEMRKKILMTNNDLVIMQQVRKPITKGYSFDKPDILRGSHDSLRPPTCLSTSQSRRVSTEENMNTARLNGDLVYLKYLVITSPFELKRKAMQQLCVTYELRNENLNPFLGCLADSQRPALVWEHCSRGSLFDVLGREDIKLDWPFKLSLLTDLVRGMRYLHNSVLKCHGRLNSKNCVIDSRWVLKITDYGLPAFFQCQAITAVQPTAKEMLWTAPECLRNPVILTHGSPFADVYSFSIIMQEVLVRGEPFSMLQLSAEEILEKLKHPPPLIRPSVSKQVAPPEAINIMRQCWGENPEMRPDFNQIHDLYKLLNHGKKVNIVDTMFKLLEKYSNNLEDLIQERTVQLDEEKKKTEQLLHRMLPSTVADSLKFGLPVEPEKFEEVTIYFSDIVGFTTISAYSEPMEIVDLLNDLYTAFDSTINHYNVYKVETIGDAYMVVGGLPERIDDHAGQIATMALDLLYVCGIFRIRHMPKVPLMLRIGLHTGPVVAGVVGLTMPRYCLFGDTVNTASRMESSSSAYRIHMSQSTQKKLHALGGYEIEYRGKIELKGKGQHDTFWLTGKEGFLKELPIPPSEDGDNHGFKNEEIFKAMGRKKDMSGYGGSPAQIDTQYTKHRDHSQPHSEGNNAEDGLLEDGAINLPVHLVRSTVTTSLNLKFGPPNGNPPPLTIQHSFDDSEKSIFEWHAGPESPNIIEPIIQDSRMSTCSSRVSSLPQIETYSPN